jgi:general stress protein 26
MGRKDDVHGCTSAAGAGSAGAADSLDKLGKLIEGIDIAMLTTRTGEGRLLSRPLRAQQLDDEGALWFITDRNSHKAEEVRLQPQVNASFASGERNTYVSLSGRASVVFDKARLQELWSPPMSVFYPRGIDDPELCLLRVQVESAEYWDGPGGLVGQALYLAATALTRDPGVLSENGRISFRAE